MASDTADLELESLLDFLRKDRGFDFTGYKRTTLSRRVHRRMAAIGIPTLAAYHEHLASDAAEFTSLFDTLLINVTRFFRDDAPWEFLASQVIPQLIQQVPDALPIRVWSAGCASGEEAYSLAMLFAEALGMERFRERVKIYATDVDGAALAAGRAGSYTDAQVEGIPEAFRTKYLDRVDALNVFRKELRRAVIFGRNDLVQDAPISRIDLLVCRNTLMYFTAPTQAAILARFHFALADGGILFLGRAETLLTHSREFSPVNLEGRIFGKVPRVNHRDRNGGAGRAVRLAIEPPEQRLRESAFEAGGESQVVVNGAGELVLANERARAMFSLARADIGRPLQDLELSYRPAELRSLIDRCHAEHLRIIVRDVKWRPRHALEDCWLTLEVSPLADPDGSVIGASVVFKDVTESLRLQRELAQSKEHLESAYEELQSTNEELETTNEELQSTVEELETTNEELQSTNEELETMNEELQGTNEELQAMNDELRHRGMELNDVNDFLAAVFASMRGGVVVLDRAMRVVVWNAQSEEMWGVRAAEVIETSFLELDIGFPVDRLASRIRSSLLGAREDVMPVIAARNRRGRPIECRVECAPLRTVEGVVRGVILTMEEAGSPG